MRFGRSIRHQRRLLVATIAGGVALLLLVGWGIYGLARGPASEHPSTAPTSTTSRSSSPAAAADGPRPISPTSDPELFARRVAAALFTWDTRAAADVGEWAQVVVDVADADEALATASDVRSYLPSTSIWQQLRGYGTRQWLVVDSVAVPDAWLTAQQQAQPGQIPPGAGAFTISGTRHREGAWGTEPVRSMRPVAFTVFVACERAEACRLLRLSTLDNPLR